MRARRRSQMPASVGRSIGDAERRGVHLERRDTAPRDGEHVVVTHHQGRGARDDMGGELEDDRLDLPVQGPLLELGRGVPEAA